MNTPERPDAEPPKGVSMPRWQGVLVGLVGFPLVHGVVPWALSLLTRRYGWSGRRPGRWNRLGLILVGAGTAYATWGMVLHMMEGYQWELTQKYLLRRGPYRFSRNPMYVGELALWLGWALFYGSVPVSLGLAIFGAWLSRVGVPQEERGMEARFGETYRAYKARVPRWLGFARR